MTPAQQYHERERDRWMRIAKRQWILRHRVLASVAVTEARHHNHQALYVARLTRARQAQP